jgi:GNAT superfamily N-acetyltransferase
MDETIFVRVTEVWRELSRVPEAFTEPGRTVVAMVDGALICPPGWCGYVRIGDRAVLTAPDPALVPMLSVEAFRTAPDADRLGPAVLAYPEHRGTRESAGADDVATVAADDPGVADLELAVGSEDAGEAAISDCRSRVFVVRDGSAIVAAAGYRPWLDRLAHVSVLTRTSHRGRGLAQIVSAAAVIHAEAAGLLPQWRARADNVASRSVAAALGFVEAGEQISARLTAVPSTGPANRSSAPADS